MWIQTSILICISLPPLMIDIICCKQMTLNFHMKSWVTWYFWCASICGTYTYHVKYQFQWRTKTTYYIQQLTSYIIYSFVICNTCMKMVHTTFSHVALKQNLKKNPIQIQYKQQQMFIHIWLNIACHSLSGCHKLMFMHPDNMAFTRCFRA